MTSELRLIRELGEQLAPTGEQPPRDLRHRVLSGLPPAHANSEQAITAGESRRSRSASGFASAAAALVAMTALILPAVASDTTRPAPVSDAGAVRTDTAADVLRSAMRRIAGTPGPAARPGQFVFTETVALNYNGPGAGWHLADEQTLIRKWEPVGGGQGQILVRPLDADDSVWHLAPVPGESAAVPTDADAMLAYLYRPPGADPPGQFTVGGVDDLAWQRAVDLLAQQHRSDAQRQAVLAATSRIPGLAVRTGAADLAGHNGIAIVHTGQKWPTEVVFDASTYRYLGTNRTVEPVGVSGQSMQLRTAVQRTAVVDKLGALP